MSGAVGLESGGSVPASSVSIPPNQIELLFAMAQSSPSVGGSGSGFSNVIISPFGELILGLIQVQLQNVQMFKQSAAQAAARLQQEAQQKYSAQETQFLNNLANALQQASQTGELPSQLAPSVQAYTRTGQPVTTNAIPAVQPTSTNTNITQLFTMLAQQVNTLANPSNSLTG
jgi:hypothetical protein